MYKFIGFFSYIWYTCLILLLERSGQVKIEGSWLFPANLYRQHKTTEYLFSGKYTTLIGVLFIHMVHLSDTTIREIKSSQNRGFQATRQLERSLYS